KVLLACADTFRAGAIQQLKTWAERVGAHTLSQNEGADPAAVAYDAVKEGAPHQILMVIDATTGQNALAQAKEFHETLGITGLILTKLDGTAKGGIVIAIRDELKIPIRFIGVGERIDDLREFNPKEFVDALLA